MPPLRDDLGHGALDRSRTDDGLPSRALDVFADECEVFQEIFNALLRQCLIMAGSVTSLRSPSSVVMPICTRSIFTGPSASCSRDDSLLSLTRLVSTYVEMFDILSRRLVWRSWPGLIQQRGCRPTGS